MVSNVTSEQTKVTSAKKIKKKRGSSRISVVNPKRCEYPQFEVGEIPVAERHSHGAPRALLVRSTNPLLIRSL
jgi:hypothetical protein